ncbi:hypothetical protein FRC04_002435 [Tulasnella sp. 424]|nr:hypothetical protein FRC04_002435 [Tulasnella sp. 424]KAG8967379.1 hypothetical protein FRC05_002089 [Tulasnella sp. 425]
MQASAGLPRSPYDYHSASQFQSRPQTHSTTRQPFQTAQSSSNASSYSHSAAGTGGGYWAQDRSSEDDAYGGMDDYADAYMYGDEDEPSPPAPVASTRGASGYASPSSSLPSKSSSTSPYQPYRDPAQQSSRSTTTTSPPTSPLQPPQLRHPSLSPSYRSSAASSYSSGSSSSKGQLGADLAHSHSDQRSTWRSDITNADAFAFRDYESPAPPRVVVTAPMTPPTRRMSEVEEERWEDTIDEQYARQYEDEPEEVDMTVSPLRIREKVLQQQPTEHEDPDEEASMMHPSASGRSRSMYNTANFSRPIRSSSPEEPSSAPHAISPPSAEAPIPRIRPNLEHGYSDIRPDSMASVYSTSSIIQPLSIRAESIAQPLSILRTSAAYAESNRVLPPISPTSEKGSGPPAEQPSPTKQPAQPAQVVNRKPSIRFQDPRPPPPVPPPLPPPASSIQPSGALQRSASTSGSAGAAPGQQAMQRSASVNHSTTSPNRAQIIEQARNRAPPPPPGQYNSSRSGPAALQPIDTLPNMGHSNSRSRSPAGDSVYSNYSYYDPEQVRGSAPASPAPGALSHPAAANANKGSSPLSKGGPAATPRSKSKHAGPDGTSSEPRTAEDYLQLGIQHHLDGDLVESAYCFEISAKGIGALRRANGQSIPRSSQSTSDHSHGHPGQNNDPKYAVGGEEGGCVVGMLMWGLALRSGWGLEKDEKRGFKWLRRAAEHAVEDLELAKSGKGGMGAMSKAVQTELVLAIYEVGQCFFHGWGVKQDKIMAVSYFQVAAKLGDPDAQQELAFCFLNGKGCKKDKKEAAKWYRAAVAQGASDVGLAWIFKDKYM